MVKQLEDRNLTNLATRECPGSFPQEIQPRMDRDCWGRMRIHTQTQTMLSPVLIRVTFASYLGVQSESMLQGSPSVMGDFSAMV